MAGERRRCPECGSVVSEKGVSVDGRDTQLDVSWVSCLNCDWDNKGGGE